MMPNGWKEGRVKDLVLSLDAGVSVNSEDDGNKEAEYKILKTSCVSNGAFDPFHAKSVYESHEIARLKEVVTKDTIIISRMNTPSLVGANGYVDSTIQNTFLPDRLWQVKPKKNKVIMCWLGYWFSSDHTRFVLSNLGTGTSGSMKNITKADVLDIKINIPPLSEQKKIAQILSTWDKAITTTEKLLTNSKQQKKALMQQLLTGKKRFLTEDYPWKHYSLNEIFEFKKGRGLSKDAIVLTGQRKCILYGELYTKYEEIVNIIFSRTNSADGFLSKIGDILIPCSTTTSGIDLAKAVAVFENNVLLGGDINILRPKISVDSAFMAYLLTHIKKYSIASRAQGITIIHLYGKDLKGLQVFIPIRSQEQEKISSLISICDKKIQNLKQKLILLKKEKESLMQQLLTGKRRVSGY